MISIGYSPDLIIPANNAINVDQPVIILSCFTIHGYENPSWIIRSDDVTISLVSNEAIENVTITIDRISIYHSEIYIDVNNSVEFTSSLTCQSESNSAVQHTVILTTSKRVIMYIHTQMWSLLLKSNWLLVNKQHFSYILLCKKLIYYKLPINVNFHFVSVQLFHYFM